MYCPNCASKLKDTDEVCLNCGAPIDKQTTELTTKLPAQQDQATITREPIQRGPVHGVVPPRSWGVFFLKDFILFFWILIILILISDGSYGSPDWWVEVLLLMLMYLFLLPTIIYYYYVYHNFNDLKEVIKSKNDGSSFKIIKTQYDFKPIYAPGIAIVINIIFALALFAFLINNFYRSMDPSLFFIVIVFSIFVVPFLMVYLKYHYLSKNFGDKYRSKYISSGVIRILGLYNAILLIFYLFIQSQFFYHFDLELFFIYFGLATIGSLGFSFLYLDWKWQNIMNKNILEEYQYSSNKFIIWIIIAVISIFVSGNVV
jgi:hypothetical protein